jgi:acetylornithine/N-succinyldiaminopimelate aminotransferase
VPTTDSIISRADRVLFPNYARFQVALTKGRDCRVHDADGRVYLDFVAGIAVTSLGHCHPKVTVAIQKQAQRLVHTSNLYYTLPQVELAEALTGACFADRVFFCNSGAEANEAAIKLVRKAMGPARYEIITLHGSFHGRTLNTMAATGQEKVKAGFDPLPPGFVHVPFDDPGAVAAAVGPQTADREGILLLFDEVQTGIGRLGTLFAYEHEGVAPDAMTLAKGLGNGFPIGALVARDPLARALSPGTHGTTFGGGPLACAAALAVVRTLREDPWVLENTVRMGERLRAGLAALAGRVPIIREVRGRGLLVGCELDRPARPLAEACLGLGLLVSLAGETVVRFTPPLTVRDADVDEALALFGKALEKVS